MIESSEGMDLAPRAGLWRVSATVHATDGDTPEVENGLRAERRMVGPYLEEVMTPAPGSALADFRRIAYLRHFQAARRWQYVSLDGRFPIGVLPAWSTDDEVGATLTLQFVEPGFPGLGSLIEKRIVGSNLVITRDGDNHEIVEQYWIPEDPAARKWVGVRYDYWRER